VIRALFWATVAAATVTAPAWIPAVAHSETPGRHFNVCYALRHGAPIVDIETSLVAAGYSAVDAGTLAGRMLRDHCPEQIDNVARQVGYE
jgi:hypothetical protein